jgi:hypothetical protein
MLLLRKSKVNLQEFTEFGYFLNLKFATFKSDTKTFIKNFHSNFAKAKIQEVAKLGISLYQ